MRVSFGRLFTALSLVLLVASLALWVHSLWFHAWLHRLTLVDKYMARSVHGRFELMYDTNGVDDPAGWEFGTSPLRPDSISREPLQPWWARSKFGFRWYSEQRPVTIFTVQHLTGNPDISTEEADVLDIRYPYCHLVIPYWAFVLVSGVLPAGVVLRLRRSRLRVRRRLCRRCGYDLRGTLGRCPECGEAVLALPAATPADPRVAG